MFIQFLDMCKTTVLSNMSWLSLQEKKTQLDEWFKQKGHNCNHPDFNINNKMYAEICVEIYNRKLNVISNELPDYFTTI